MTATCAIIVCRQVPLAQHIHGVTGRRRLPVRTLQLAFFSMIYSGYCNNQVLDQMVVVVACSGRRPLDDYQDETRYTHGGTANRHI